ncbi:T9SS type A sorting domain-containing protein [bacterium]|nr:T9SS type A sorting domain-containing protein [bacterium]MBU1982952.1 T9SS type A sorting domain-containing protein [bacterium]
MAGCGDYQSATGVTYPLLTIGSGVAQQYGVDRQYLVIDGDGVVRWIGPTHSLPMEAIQDTIETYLARLDAGDSPPPFEPIVFELGDAYPNPFNARTTIPFSLSASAFATITIYNVLGQEVAKLAGGFIAAGAHRISWNAGNQATGIYMVKLESGGQHAVRKLILMK